MAWFLPGLFAAACVIGFCTCMGIGANDLANSFGTAYGAKVLTMPQLVVIAFIAEMGGATLMGATVSSTVKGSVVNTKKFEDNAAKFMWGMTIALGSTGLWLGLATWKSLPVSTTHSVIGAVMGFGLVEYGFKDGVIWAKKKDSFPFVKGVVPVFISWFASPLVAGILSVMMYLFLRVTLLKKDPRDAPLHMAIIFALIVYVAMFVNAYFILIKGLKARVKWSKGRSAWVSALIALPFAIAAFAVVMWLIKRIRASEAAKQSHLEQMEGKRIDAGRTASEEADRILAAGVQNAAGNDPYAPASLEHRHAEFLETAMEARTHYMRKMYDEFQDAEFEAMVTDEKDKRKELKDGMEDSSPLQEHRLTSKYAAVQYNEHVEYGLFRYLQIFTSVCVAFAHGANDVANGVGPVGAVYSVSKSCGEVGKKSDTPIWILAVGGFAIGVGLAIFGRNILEVVGNEIVQLTPARGFSAEFATAGTVMIASVSGLPVSTTQIITGGVIGIGLVDDYRKAIDWKLCIKIFSGWVVTIIITVCTTAIAYLPVHFEVAKTCGCDPCSTEAPATEAPSNSTAP